MTIDEGSQYNCLQTQRPDSCNPGVVVFGFAVTRLDGSLLDEGFVALRTPGDECILEAEEVEDVADVRAC